MTVPDDKNEKNLWVIRKCQYLVALAGYVTNSKTWKFTPGTKEEALEEMKQKLKRDVPLRLQLQLKVTDPGNDKWTPPCVLQHKVEVPRREWPGTNVRERGPLVLSKDRTDHWKGKDNGNKSEGPVLRWIGDMDAKNGSE